MDQIVALKAEIAALKASITRLERQDEKLMQWLDQARRAVRLSSILDEQVLHINARVPYGRGDAA
jgi:predicted RNase H-like nuclease (RuvC/YqgF family)